jgi:hypothetical protein
MEEEVRGKFSETLFNGQLKPHFKNICKGCVETVLFASGVDVGVVAQQQLGGFSVSIQGAKMQGGLIAD